MTDEMDRTKDILMGLAQGLERLIDNLGDMDIGDEDYEYLSHVLKGAFYICLNGGDEGVEDCEEFYDYIKQKKPFYVDSPPSIN